MHTFFVNTSCKDLKDYEELFDIYTENMVLVPLECRMNDWYHAEQGFAGCVRKINALIDGFVEINDAFNLVLYIDLSEQEKYASLPRDLMWDIQRNACMRAMRILFAHVIKNTIVRELISIGRQPQDILLMFGEDKRYTDKNPMFTEPSRHAVNEKLYELLGIPGEEKIVEVAKKVWNGADTDKVAAFAAAIEKECGDAAISGIRGSYTEDLSLWHDAVINDQNVPKANEDLIERIRAREHAQLGGPEVQMLSCPYDFYASTTNKKVHALSCMNISLHLLKCVRANTVYTQQSAGEHQRKLIPFREYTTAELVGPLKRKMIHYEEMANKTKKMSKLYSELGMAPRLPVFNHGKFGLDEFGKKAVSLVVTDVKEQNAASGAEQTEEVIKVEGNGKQVEVVARTGQSLFSREDYKPFDYTGTYANEQLLKKGSKPEEYVAQALELRKHHLNYLRKLKNHVTVSLSNYAGKSRDNKPALLGMGDIAYSLPGEGDEQSKDMRSLEVVEPIAQTAYTTMLDQYMHFCAGRSVAITDIEEQCNWYVSRVNQISDSIRKIKWIAAGSFAALLALYVPFVLLQFEAITRNTATFCAALGSIAAPLVLMYAGMAVLAMLQRKKYTQAGEELIERSNQIIAENEMAARKFDQLLTAAVPALRWVYEYKLDAQYCAECCDVADAKIEHHRKKMINRADAIRNIISDLDHRDMDDEDWFEEEAAPLPKEVDYRRPYCVGKKNIAFYTIADGSILGEEGGDA